MGMAALVRPGVLLARTCRQVGLRMLYSTATNGEGQSALPHLPRPARLPTQEEFAKASSDTTHARPLLLPGLVSSENQYPWPACLQWSYDDPSTRRETLQGMRNEHTSDLLVDVEIGRKGHGYMDKESGAWDKIKMPFDLFLDAFIAKSIPSSSPDLVGYVAQQDLIASVPLWQDALQPALPHSRSGPKGDKGHWMSNIWIGPEGTFTPIHKDPYHNLFVQVIGRKRVHVFPPSTSHHLHLSETGTQQNTSKIPTEDYLLTAGEQDRDRFPELSHAMHHTQSAHAVLQPGDAIYIPKGWFHCVKSLDTSVSVNDWWV